MVKRLYVEKKEGFGTEALYLKKELQEKLKIKGIKGVRILDRYDVEGVPDDQFENIKDLVFSEQGISDIYEEDAFFPGGADGADGAFVFGIEFLPGGYDQKADSVLIAIRLIIPEAEVYVRSAKVIVISGETDGSINESEKEKILGYLINPTDSRLASFDKPDTLEDSIPAPPDVAVCDGFCGMEESVLGEFVNEMGFAMNEDDLLFVQKYFREEEKRDPTVTELRAIDTYWSDHCRHTTFLTHLTDIYFEEGENAGLVKKAYEDYLRLREEVYGEAAAQRPVTMMDMATIGAKYLRKKGLLNDLDESEEVNACSVKIKAEMIPQPGAEPEYEDWLFMFKNETHNHPTEIEPFGGAGTCLGGGIRDPLSGRAHVHQAMRITGCADPRVEIEDTIKGKLPQYLITRTAAKGYSSYGNQVGGTSGFIEEIYDEGFLAKRMELGALVAAAPAENVVREQPVPGDAILIVGGRTGRDGIGAATGSSKEQTKESISTAGAEVQKGNPAIECDIIRLFQRAEASRLIKRCNDFGAGGVSVAIGELAPSIDVDLDKVPAKYDGLDGTELAVSESQERMAVVISEENYETFCAYAREENLEATQVATVTDTGRFRMFWRGKLIFDLSRKFLDTSGATQKRKARILEKNISFWGNPPQGSLLELLSDLNVAGKRGLIEYFDSTIGSGTLLMPLGGKSQLTPALGMSAKLPILKGDTNTATLMSYGFDPEIAGKSAFHSAMYAVLDSCAKICAMGGDAEKIRLSFQEFFPRLGLDEARWGSPVMALLGALQTQMALGVPSIGGKDSMSGTFHNIDIVPTLASFAVCTTDAQYVLSPELKKCGSRLVLLKCPRDEKLVPDFEAFRKNAKRVYELAGKGKILAASTIPHGGLFAAVSKMAIGNGIGAVLTLDGSSCYGGEGCGPSILTNESYGALLLEIGEDEDINVLFEGLNYLVVGRTADTGRLEIEYISEEDSGAEKIEFTLEEIIERWENPLAGVFPVEADSGQGGCQDLSALPEASLRVPGAQPYESESCSVKLFQAGFARETLREAVGREPQGPRPRVVIPVFPGALGETDAMRAFERAGAEVKLAKILSRDPDEIRESVKRAADEIRNSQIVMIPGGASYGDAPGGSAKLTKIILQNPYMKEAIEDFLENKDGLILGVGSGFQALIGLGLLPYGRYAEWTEGDPVITTNTIGRHMSKIVRVRVNNVASPWFTDACEGDIHSLPVSVSEGRFYAGEKVLETLALNGQIATQFVDLSDNPTNDIRFNPVGSVLAVEGLVSPDGRIFGRIGNAERNAPGIYKNVPGNYSESVFTSGLAYFF